MSFRSDDERALLLAFYQWLDERHNTLDEPEAIPIGELIDAFVEERTAR